MTNHAPPVVFYQTSAQLLGLLFIALVVQLRQVPILPAESEPSWLRRLATGAAIALVLAEVVGVFSIIAGEVAAITALADGPTLLKLQWVRGALAFALSTVTGAAVVHITRSAPLHGTSAIVVDLVTRLLSIAFGAVVFVLILRGVG